MAAREPRRVDRGPLVAGVELGAGALRAVLGRREDGRLRVVAASAASLPAGAVSGGLVVDRAAVTAAAASLLDELSPRERAARTVIALDGDDVRTYHTATAFERMEATEPINAAEAAKAVREAREEAARAAQAAVSDDPALRGIVTTQLDAALGGLVLDGRPLATLVGFHGRSVVVHTDVALAPLLTAGAASAVLDGARRRGGATSGIYALARLLVASGYSEGGVLRLGADVTAYAVVRDGRVVATRVFGLGRDALLARDGTRETDAKVWARCVLAPHDAVEGHFPSRWVFVGVPESLIALPRALGDERGGRVDISPLKVSGAGRLATEADLHADHLVAAGAAAIAAELY
ncbi:MAG TPA: hypothetical protein VFM93_07090 [Candidatus Limnocylindria bacterium]|nr:hypothetical protein [Candidatus Limnocylindria bacterium]